MINLLNPDDLQQIRAARTNVKLLRYTLLTFATLIIVAGVYVYGFYQASSALHDADQRNRVASDQLSQYNSLKDAAATYRGNLTIAKKILDNQFIFSDYIDNIAAILPAGTILDNLTLSTKSVASTTQGKPTTTDIQVRAKSYDGILSLKTAFESHAELFSNVHITATSFTANAKGTSAVYPYAATFNVVIVKQKGSAS